jgi:hypothetical protein
MIDVVQFIAKELKSCENHAISQWNGNTDAWDPEKDPWKPTQQDWDWIRNKLLDRVDLLYDGLRMQAYDFFLKNRDNLIPE